MRDLAAVLVVGLLLAGCGQGEEGLGSEPAPGTSVSVSVVAAEGAEPTVMTLECDPIGGDHPNAQAACDKLMAADAKVLEPVPADQACTMIYGGPQTATITGTLDGEPIDAAFSRENGCEIDRWDALGTEVFDVPLQ